MWAVYWVEREELSIERRKMDLLDWRRAKVSEIEAVRIRYGEKDGC